MVIIITTKKLAIHPNEFKVLMLWAETGARFNLSGTKLQVEEGDFNSFNKLIMTNGLKIFQVGKSYNTNPVFCFCNTPNEALDLILKLNDPDIMVSLIWDFQELLDEDRLDDIMDDVTNMEMEGEITAEDTPRMIKYFGFIKSSKPEAHNVIFNTIKKVKKQEVMEIAKNYSNLKGSRYG